MPYHGLSRWSQAEMRRKAAAYSYRPKFKIGQEVETQRKNGVWCSAQIESVYELSSGRFEYLVKTYGDYARLRKMENEIR